MCGLGGFFTYQYWEYYKNEFLNSEISFFSQKNGMLPNVYDGLPLHRANLCILKFASKFGSSLLSTSSSSVCPGRSTRSSVDWLLSNGSQSRLALADFKTQFNIFVRVVIAIFIGSSEFRLLFSRLVPWFLFAVRNHSVCRAGHLWKITSFEFFPLWIFLFLEVRKWSVHVIPFVDRQGIYPSNFFVLSLVQTVYMDIPYQLERTVFLFQIFVFEHLCVFQFYGLDLMISRFVSRFYQYEALVSSS